MLFGPPGCGKGTQAQILSNEFSIAHLSTGDMLRDAVARGTEVGLKAKKVMDGGKLVSDEVVVSIISEQLEQDICKLGFVLDGFPRTLAQAKALDALLRAKGLNIERVVEIRVLDDLLIERISGRFACIHCGEGYHDTFKQPKEDGACDKCNGTEFTRREDDNEKTVRERLENYYAQTSPLLPFYKNKDLLSSVDGMLEIGEVSMSIKRVLNASGND